MEKSIFSRIIDGEIPSHKVFEDGKTLAFLDIHPFRPGHTLIVPKVQVDHVDDLAEEDYQALWKTVQSVMKRVKNVLGVQRAVVLVMGYDVPHAHVHVLPADTAKDFMHAVALRADPSFEEQEPDHPALAKMAQKLQF